MKKSKKENNSRNMSAGPQTFLATLDYEMSMYDHILNAIYDCERYKWGSEVLDHLISEIRKKYEEMKR